MRQVGRGKVVVAKREKERDGQEQKKTTKKIRWTKKKENKINSVVVGLNLTAFLKDPEGCPLDHRCVPIRALRTNFDLLPIHIGSVSNIQSGIVTKKNGYYNGY